MHSRRCESSSGGFGPRELGSRRIELESARSAALSLDARGSADGERLGLSSVRASELAQCLSDKAFAYETTRDNESLRQLESLTREAVAHVRRVGLGSVDHIILSSVLQRIVVRVASVRDVLQKADWRWSQ